MRRNISENIKYIRHKCNLSQDRFGKKIGVSGKTISAYEKGTILPSMKVLERLSETYNVTSMGINKEHLSRLEEEIKNVQESLSNIWKMIGLE